MNTQISVLTIDDDTDLRRGIVSYLEDKGFTVYQASGGQEGIEMFQKFHADLVFTDLMMPVVDGLAVVKEIRKLSPDTPIVVISGNGSVQYAIETIRAGAWDYITKPIVDFSVFDSIVDEVLSRAQELRSERDRVERAEKRGEEIVQHAGRLAHDFNNIITGISGNLSLAQMHLDDAEKTARYIRSAEQGGRRATDLAKKFVSIAKEPDTHGGGSIEVGPLVKECLALILAASRVIYEVRIPENLPMVVMESGEFCQVINNLALNSSQAMPNGGKLVVLARELTLESKNEHGLQPGLYVMIQITDNGSGIPSAVMAKIFEPHFTTKEEGSGLGLASVKGIVNKHNGVIEIESTEGAGTAVTLLLPASCGSGSKGALV